MDGLLLVLIVVIALIISVGASSDRDRAEQIIVVMPVRPRRRGCALLLLAVFLLVLALLQPGRVGAAQPPTGPCQIAHLLGAFSARLPALSNLPLVDKTNVEIAGTSVTLNICAPSGEGATAQRMLQLLARALPVLNTHAGLPYNGPQERWIVIVGDQELPEQIDGLFREEDGIILLNRSSVDWTVIHEGAHYWANDRHFDAREPWLAEAYAQYLTMRALDDLAIAYDLPLPHPACDSEPLQAWNYRSGSSCAYSVGLALFRDLAQSVGPDQLRAALTQLKTSYHTINSWGLLEHFHRSGVYDLADVQRRIFPPHLLALIEGQAKLWQDFHHSAARATQLGLLMPSPLLLNIERGYTDAAAQTLAALLPLLDQAVELQRRCATLQLACMPALTALSDDPAALAQAASTVQWRHQVLDAFEHLVASITPLGLTAPTHVAELAAAGSAEAIDAANRYAASSAEGQKLAQRCGEVGIRCSHTWQEYWRAGDLAAADLAIAEMNLLLNEAATVEQRCEAVLQRCRQEWQTMLDAQGVPAARQLLQRLELLLRRATAAAARCGPAQEQCLQLWRKPFSAQGTAAGQAALEQLEGLLAEADKVGLRCGAVEGTCRNLWQKGLQQSGVAAMGLLLEDLKALLVEADVVTERCGALSAACRTAWHSTFAVQGSAAARRELQAITALQQRVTALNARCAAAGWRCPELWQTIFVGQGAQSASDWIDQADQVQQQLEKTSAILRRPVAGAALLMPHSGDLLSQALGAFATGNLVTTEQLARQARKAYTVADQRSSWISYLLIGALAITLFAALLVLWRRRRTQRRGHRSPMVARPNAQPDTNDDLLATLLAQPPTHSEQH